MRILFIAHWNEDKENTIGKKLQGQVNAFEELGHHVTAIRFQEGAVWAIESVQKQKLFPVAENGFVHLLAIPRAVHMLLQNGERYDFSYARRTFCTPWHLMMLRELKSNGVFTVEELPTYPYDDENKLYTRKSYQIAAAIERACRKYYHHWLDLFTTVSFDTEIFQVPAIHIDNGVDLNTIPYVERVYVPNEPIHIVAISSMKPWHGYERLIRGLANFKQIAPERAKRFIIEMVGDGPMKDQWKTLSEDLNISEQVIFHGQQTGGSLDAIVNRCQIAVGSLGINKISSSFQVTSTLKVREYLARGIPFIYAVRDSLPLEDSYGILVENDDSPIDFLKLENFCDQLILQKDISFRMRSFAEKYISWTEQMKIIVDEVEQRKY